MEENYQSDHGEDRYGIRIRRARLKCGRLHNSGRLGAGVLPPTVLPLYAKSPFFSE